MRLPRLLWICALALPVLADEGLWLFSQFPKDAFREQHEAAVTDAFLDHLRLASARIGGGTGAFVSARGLLLTNQHVAADCLAKAGAREGGFYAGSAAQEIRCPGLEAEVLVAIGNVTERVKSSAPAAAKPAEAVERRNAAIAEMEKECAGRTGNVCSVVKLYSGERYDLYHYRKYGDLRLVFAPERAMAQFGGSPANLTYPRYALDFAFLRAWENGAPAATAEFLKWSAAGAQDGATVFAVGSPRATSRLATVAQLDFYRDTMLGYTLARVQSRITDLRAFAAKSAANQHAAELTLDRLGAEYKLLAGKLIGLNDATLMARKANFERRLRNAVQHDPKLGAEGAKVWDEVAAAYKAWAPSEHAYQVLAFPMTDAPDPAVKAVLEARYQAEIQGLKEKQVEAAGARLAKKHREIIEALETSAAERIAQYRYRIFGDADYPDATGTPRVTFGVVKAYRDRTLAPAPYATTFGGLYHLAMPAEPYRLPEHWAAAKAVVDLVAPMNFASTCDITSGASGPVVDLAGEIVGLTFDGNLESIPLTYLYSDESARAVHVAGQGIVEALRKVYRTPGLLRELGVAETAAP